MPTDVAATFSPGPLANVSLPAITVVVFAAGSNLLTVAGATTISGGLTIGGTAGLTNKGTVTQSGGNVTLGDVAGHLATLDNISIGTWKLTDDSGIVLGSATASTIVGSPGGTS